MSVIDRVRAQLGSGSGPRPTWRRLRAALDDCSVERTLDLLVRATEEERRAFEAQLVPYLEQTRPEQWWSFSRPTPGPALSVAAVGTAPSAARAAAFLCRRRVRAEWRQLPVDAMVEMAQARGVDWLGDVAVRLAARLDDDTVAWQRIAALVREAGGPVPTGDAFVTGWIGSYVYYPSVDIPATLRTDPFRDTLLPRAFEVDGLGALMANPTYRPRDERPRATLVAAVAALVGEGVLDRTAVLDACLGRLLRGDRPGSVRAFVVLHDGIAPSVEEIAARQRDYLRLLPDAHSTVVAMAQRALRAVDDAGQLALEPVLEASRALLLRPEKTLVRSQLSWLDRLAKRHRDRSAEVLDAAITTMHNEHLDLRDQASKIVARHRGTPAEVEVVTGDVAAVAGQPKLPRPVPSPMPPLPAPAELAAHAVALLTARYDAGPQPADTDPVLIERVLAGLVHWAAADPHALSEALTPVLRKHDEYPDDREHSSSSMILHYLVSAAVRTAAGVAHPPGWQRAVEATRERLEMERLAGRELPEAGRSLPEKMIDHGLPGPHHALRLRIAEVALRLAVQSVPMLVATPTEAAGLLDPAVLVERLARAEREGWQPWPCDLEQALLRLPLDPDPAVVRAAGALQSPAGRTLARWLASGSGPTSTVVTQTRKKEVPSWDDRPARRLQVALAPPPGMVGPLMKAIFELDPGTMMLNGSYYWTDWPRLWPAVAPAYREAIAAWVLTELVPWIDQERRGGAGVLPMLAECAGPAGPAMHIALAYTLAARHDADRVAAVDALLTLAAGDDLDGGAVGRYLGDLAADKIVKLTRVVSALRDAERAGAADAVWQVAAGALPALLAATPPPPGTPDLLALAAQAAAASGKGPGSTVPGLAEVAARAGSSRLVTEARRLGRVLG